jgi:hypothetical protein
LVHFFFLSSLPDLDIFHFNYFSLSLYAFYFSLLVFVPLFPYLFNVSKPTEINNKLEVGVTMNTEANNKPQAKVERWERNR